MDQRGNRCRAFHRIRQPDMQRHLRRLAHRADEQEDARGAHQRHGSPVSSGNENDRHIGKILRPVENRLVIQCPEMRQNQANPKDEAEVADTIDQKCFHVGQDCRRARIPEADQQVGHEANGFPTEKQLHEVVAHHQHQHGEGKQRDVAEEAVIARIFVHVADGVYVHHQRNEGHHEHHGHGQGINQETYLERVVSRGEPLINRSVERVSGRHIPEDENRCDEGKGNTGDRHGVRHPARDHAAEQPRNDRPEQRSQGDEQIECLHFHVQPFRLSRSSTWMVFRLRNSTTRIARPIADSAAATVRMKKTKTCPARSCR